MADRQVFATRKNDQGDITALCNRNDSWSPRSKEDAVLDIESEIHSYYVIISSSRVNIHVVNDPRKGKYLRTDPDKTTINNLDTLPDC
jgi:hypothetical protein